MQYYKLVVVKENGEQKELLKRFSEFIDLYEKVRRTCLQTRPAHYFLILHAWLRSGPPTQATTC